MFNENKQKIPERIQEFLLSVLCRRENLQSDLNGLFCSPIFSIYKSLNAKKFEVKDGDICPTPINHLVSTLP
jgi:hypothetical protein